MSSLSTIPTTEPVLVDEVKPPLPVSAPSSSSSASSSSADACAGAGGELAKECPIPLPTEPIKSLSDLVAALQDGFAKGLKKEDKETYLKALLSLYDQSSCPERARFTLWSDSKLYSKSYSLDINRWWTQHRPGKGVVEGSTRNGPLDDLTPPALFLM